VTGWAFATALVLLAVAAAALWRAMQRPQFVAGLGGLFAGLLLKSLLWAAKPRNFTPSQREAIREGLDPFRDRPHGGHG
jgi:hypothetical protein